MGYMGIYSFLFCVRSGRKKKNSIIFKNCGKKLRFFHPSYHCFHTVTGSQMVVLTFPLTSRMLQSFLPVTFVLTNEICIKKVWAEKVYFFRKTFFFSG